MGHADYNDQQVSHGTEPISLGEYVTSSSFGVDVAENWQSEYLQFLFTIGTVWLVQRGSPESKKPEDIGPESDADQLIGPHARAGSPNWARTGGWRTAVYSSSLGLVMGSIFLAAWTVQSVAGWATYNAEQLSQRQDPVSWGGYLGAAEFWNRTLQNWQSELLAVGSFAVLAIFLRQRGSPESKGSAMNMPPPLRRLRPRRTSGPKAPASGWRGPSSSSSSIRAVLPGLLRQDTRSTTAAIPIPPPMHSVTRP